ncbi:MAG: hypothetical protein DI569_15280 [Sphingopyxis macrogoltabida]|uniref:Uncharacterized protein n=1 Tax=Sphingopyxis macrogoltabida TaxID=33050 RepID=A0A2W5KWS8_SPHMC|nr:MAG: hypothetical protein DI569_15280 [Sphingopyxis macrogoltabida]
MKPGPFDVNAWQKRAARLEKADLPTPSPLVQWFGSFDAWVEREVLPGLENGTLAPDDIVAVVAVLRRWEADGTWAHSQGTFTGEDRASILER